MQTEVNEKPRYAIVAAVQLPNVSDAEFASSLAELSDLAKTLGYKVTRTFTQKRSGFDKAAYLGTGKREEIREFVASEPKHGDSNPVRPEPVEGSDHFDILFVDHEISPMQARNLEKEVGCEVMDRTMVILEIFHRNARSPAARAQVEIARLGYMAPRLREQAKLAGPQGRQRSGTGGRGAGESHTELDKRKIRDRIAELQKEIAAMEVERKTQRARRQDRQGGANVALVGYTNAGKSTLMRALTGSDVFVANKLFATLDTTVRALHPESVPRVLVSDTVGFIKNLPHGLVASFKSTLEEALDASLLLHVIDASDPGFERQLQVTDAVLAEIEAQDVPRLRIFNKIDQVNGGGDAVAQEECAAALRAMYPGCIVISAKRPQDIARLHQTIVAFFQRDLVEAELFLPWTAQQLRGEIFARCEVLAERAEEEGAFFRVRSEQAALDSLHEQISLV
ncbi:GTPase HflX [Georgfuchsia toluolica]|uniref:GTPase HflX n=1 Tax=Georgfuchsia toluolica TaxID=424218 RepID=A0A916NHA3_9PROT|nr:GTPase HflX [Georgfuchsia toluolica]CAG4883106.1 GTPase HflX [Georgfuchsia toluolica]